MQLWKLKACPKCKGAIFGDADKFGRYLSCVNCGWSKDLSEGAQLPRSRIDDDCDREGISDGCDISPSCFSCPLPECLWDQPKTRHTYLRDQKTLEIFQQYQHLGTAHAAVATAKELGTTDRSVYRMLQRNIMLHREAS
jgi:hypothetical protein